MLDDQHLAQVVQENVPPPPPPAVDAIGSLAEKSLYGDRARESSKQRRQRRARYSGGGVVILYYHRSLYVRAKM